MLRILKEDVDDVLRPVGFSLKVFGAGYLGWDYVVELDPVFLGGVILAVMIGFNIGLSHLYVRFRYGISLSELIKKYLRRIRARLIDTSLRREMR